MITDAVFAFFGAILTLLNGLLPEWTPIDLDPMLDAIESPTGGVAVAFGLLRWANYYAPVTEAIALGALGLTLYIAALIYRVAMKLGRTTHLFGGAK